MQEKLNLPKMFLAKQKFQTPKIDNLELVINSEANKIELKKMIKEGETVAITAGSRGIKHLKYILKGITNILKEIGAIPFIIPAMGSHGGATVSGQTKILEDYGITEEFIGCEIKASMDVVNIGKTENNTSVFMDKIAYEANHTVIVNRIKLHTKLNGDVESGLLKMSLIGLGKQKGAKTYHRAIAKYGWMCMVDQTYEILKEKSNILCGFAIIQNAEEDIAEIHGVNFADFRILEPKLLKRSKELMGRLPFEQCDLLIVDEMGKNISGTGLDTNITGRKEGSKLKITHVYVRDITDVSHGNSQGIGLVDFTNRKLVEKIDFKKMYMNSQTAYRTDSCKIPMYLDNDYEVLKVALYMAGIEDPSSYKIIWIKNTLELEEIFLSEAYLDLLQENQDLEKISDLLEIKFNENGNLINPMNQKNS